MDSYVCDDGIEDFHGDDTFKQGGTEKRNEGEHHDLEGMDDDDLDLDYSQTQVSNNILTPDALYAPGDKSL